MAAPTDVLLEHEADGIQEYDNPMPAWWLGIFYVTIAFTVVFIPYLHMTGWSQEAQYEEEVAAAEAKYAPAREAKEAAQKQAAKAASKSGPSAADVVAGEAIYAGKCVACHMADGTGGIGPDLTDAEWLHGGSLAQITNTVNVGVPAKGMLAWGPVIGDEQVRQVSAYVHTLGGGE
jgi:cytochrome c oxidase cbb3-type subunit III